MKPNLYEELIKQIGDYPEVQKAISTWIEIIEAKGITVGTRSDKSASSFENGIIKISCTEMSSKGTNVLWDLVHEYGHSLDPDMSDLRMTPREIRAWEIARQLLIQDGISDEELHTFDEHKNKKLFSYRINDLLPWREKECKILFKDGSCQQGKFIILHTDGRLCMIQDGEYRMYPGNDMVKVIPLPAVT
jgi:hypothetical protein